MTPQEIAAEERRAIENGADPEQIDALRAAAVKAHGSIEAVADAWTFLDLQDFLAENPCSTGSRNNFWPSWIRAPSGS